MLVLHHHDLTIEVRDEPPSARQRWPESGGYASQFGLDPSNEALCCHGVNVRDSEHAWSALLLGGSDLTDVHAHSAVCVDDVLVVACSNAIFALDLPELRLRWIRIVQGGSCYGVYLVPGSRSLVAHGELSVEHLAFDGRSLWSAGGREVLNGPFTLMADRVRVVDFDGVPNEFALADGRLLGGVA